MLFGLLVACLVSLVISMLLVQSLRMTDRASAIDAAIARMTSICRQLREILQSKPLSNDNIERLFALSEHGPVTVPAVMLKRAWRS